MLSRCNRRVLRALASVSVALTFAAGQATYAQNVDVFTIAGSGASGFFGEGISATDPSVRMNMPTGVVADAAGNVYIADQANHVIRKVDTSGLISTVAGTGVAGYVDGDAASAQFSQPFGLDLDPAGNLVVADLINNVIRHIDLVTLQVTTIAGDGNTGPFPEPGATPLQASFNQPIDVDVDASGAIFVVDRRHHVIRRIAPDGLSITTVAGNGVAGFSGNEGDATAASLNLPQGVFVDSTGNIYIADTNNHSVRRVDAGTQVIHSVAGDGNSGGFFSGDGFPASDARLNSPRAVHVDSAGNIYIADTVNHRVRRIDVGGVINTFAGSGPFEPGLAGEEVGEFNGEGGAATDSRFDFVADVFADAFGNVYIADENNDRVRRTFPETLNAAPTDIDLDLDDLTDGSIVVNSSEGRGARAVRLIAEDADAGDTHVYDLVRGKGNDNNDDFTVTNAVLRVDNPRLTIGDLLVRVVADDQKEFDPDGATFQKPLEVTVVDDMPPVITLVGDNPLTVNLNDAYVDPGATAIDNEEPSLDISTDIVIDSSAVNTSLVGDYEVTYDVTDASGNAATTVIRTVSVESADTTPPVITLLGDNPLLLLIGDTYVDPGATAVDDVDGDITANIVVGGDVVNTDVEGNYTVTYTVSDASGNPAQETRTVTVSAEPPPALSSDMSIDGSGPTSIETGSAATYTVSVTNGGPDDTTGVTATIGVPTNLVAVDSVSSGQGTCTVDGATITCDLGDLADAESVDITINVTASDSAGSGAATIDVTSDNDDADASNNGGSIDISVTSPAPPPPPPPPPPSGGGGGSTGLLLLGLLALTGIRRRLIAD